MDIRSKKGWILLGCAIIFWFVMSPLKTLHKSWVQHPSGQSRQVAIASTANPRPLDTMSEGQSAASQTVDGYHEMGEQSVWVSDRQIRLPRNLRLLYPNKSSTLLRLSQKNKSHCKLMYLYDQYLTKPEIDCRWRARLGGWDLGAYDLCLVKPYEPGPDCLMYGFGVGNMWAFEDALTKEYDCFVRMFDPTMQNYSYEHSHNVMFYPLGLGDKDDPNGTFRVKTLKTFIKDFGDDNRIIDILKIDIEGNEYKGLDIILKDNILWKVKQLIMEFHLGQEPSVSRLHMAFETFRRIRAFGFMSYMHYPCLLGNSLYYSNVCEKYKLHIGELSFININFLDPSYKPLELANL